MSMLETTPRTAGTDARQFINTMTWERVEAFLLAILKNLKRRIDTGFHGFFRILYCFRISGGTYKRTVVSDSQNAGRCKVRKRPRVRSQANPIPSECSLISLCKRDDQQRVNYAP